MRVKLEILCPSLSCFGGYHFLYNRYKPHKIGFCKGFTNVTFLVSLSVKNESMAHGRSWWLMVAHGGSWSLMVAHGRSWWLIGISGNKKGTSMPFYFLRFKEAHFLPRFTLKSRVVLSALGKAT